MNMKSIATAIAGAALLATAQVSFGAEPLLCLSGVCLGATLTEIPTNIKWLPMPTVSNRAQFVLADFDTKLSRTLQADAATIHQLEQHRNLTGDIATISPQVIAILQKVRGSCSYFTLDGTFLSESGHKTTVTIKAYPSADGLTQQFRVSKISREYADVRGADEHQRLAEQLQQQLHYDFLGIASRQAATATATLSDAPAVGFNLMAENIFYIAESSKLYASTTNADIYRRLPGCSHPVNVN